MQYRVTTSSDDAVWNDQDHTDATLTTTITGLTNGQSYDVWVRAENSVGDSDWSPVATGTPALPPDRPAKPTLIARHKQLEVLWIAPSTNGAPISIYSVQYRPGTSGEWLPYRTASAIIGLYTIIVPLINGQSYQVQVQANSPAGDSLWSPTATGTPIAAPDAPTKPTLTPRHKQLEVSWTAPAPERRPHLHLQSAVPPEHLRRLRGVVTLPHCECPHRTLHHHRPTHQRPVLRCAGAGDQLGRRKRVVTHRHGHPDSSA